MFEDAKVAGGREKNKNKSDSGVQTLSSFFCIFFVFYIFLFLSKFRNFVITKFILYNLWGQSIRTSMQNLEAVAQKMAELLH